MAAWQFTAMDNSGYFQAFKVKAKSKLSAIEKGMEKGMNILMISVINFRKETGGVFIAGIDPRIYDSSEFLLS